MMLARILKGDHGGKVFLLVLPFYYMLVYPFCYLLNRADTRGSHVTGTGLIVRCKK